ncbi:MAG: hypothetical protein ACRDZX_14455 [Acidimicrobiales bacterium]
MSPSRLRRGIGMVGASAAMLPALALLLATPEAAVAGAPTTSSVLTAAKRAIGKQTSVHLVVTSRSSSTSVEEHAGADLGKTRGVETISEGSQRVMIKVTPAHAYLSGNSSGLTKIVGLTAAEAKRVGKDWVSVKAGTSQYKELATSMTLSSVAGVLPTAKSTRLYLPASPGKKLYTLKWDTAATSSEPALASTLTLSAVGATLPVRETTTAAGGGKETVALSKWGEHVLVSAPAAGSTIPYSKVSS